MTFLTGAQSLLRAASRAGIDTCFANPGTTEMSLVAALDDPGAPRAILGLFEGVCTGAADGYARMLGRPALTLTHLGPGFANGIANLHNARRARVPVVNVIGDHASWHLRYDAPLASDIASLARPVSAWYRSVASPADCGPDLHDAVTAACAEGGRIATLVVPMDHQADAVPDTDPAPAPAEPLRVHLAPVPAERIESLARALAAGAPAAFLLGATALTAEAQTSAGRIATATGARLFAETFPSRTERGGGLPDIDRLPYFPEAASAALAGASRVVLVGTREPVSYFGYPGIPAELAPPGSMVTLAGPHEDGAAALHALAALLHARGAPPTTAVGAWPIEPGALTPQAVGRLLANALPEGAIVSVEGGTCGYPFATAAARAQRHTILTNTGGAIGQGLPVAVGAALACPDRRVFALQSDGSAQYTIQALWTMARCALPVIVLIASNRRYAILQNELGRAGLAQPGPQAMALTRLDDPPFDWVALARGYGVPASRVATADALQQALSQATVARDGPCLVEMQL
jgi:acetolactate synthase-1/2/3 large subunit